MSLLLSLEVLGPRAVHGDTRIAEESPLRIVTAQPQWAYAVTYRLADPEIGRFWQFGGRVGIMVSVLNGRIGVGVTTEAGDAFIVEKFTSERDGQISLVIPAGTRAGDIVLRNASAIGPSEFVLTGLRVESLEHSFPYPVRVTARSFERETAPADGDTGIVFDTEAARRINAARLEWLEEASDIVRSGGRVLDAGAGVGHFIRFYQARGCSVVAIDGRASNVEELRRRYPDIEARVGDVQRLDPLLLGRFDVIHSFGLLYHLESPIAALRLFRDLCQGVLILETMVCDSSVPVSILEDETKAASQALAGLGCRPSPAFLALALNRVGFPYVYGASRPPRHEEFNFAWQDNLQTTRDNHPLRCIFVAADAPIAHPSLISILD